MSKHMWTRAIWGIAAMTALAGFAMAQQSATDPAQKEKQDSEKGAARTHEGGRRHTGAMQHVGIDQQLAACLIRGNKMEIECAQMAQQRASNEEVKKFAKQMIDDHTKFLNELEQFASQHGARSRSDEAAPNATTNEKRFRLPGIRRQVATNNNENKEDAERAAATQRHVVNRNIGGARGQHVSFFQIAEEVADLVGQSIKHELSQKEGAQFDRCYMGMQVMAHMNMVNVLTVFDKYASSDLQPILKQGLATTKQHLASAKALSSRLDQGTPKSTASRQPSTINAN